MHDDNRIRGSPFFIAAANDSLRELVTVSYPWNTTEHTPIFTGIPPHVLMMAEIESLRMKLEKQTKDIVGAIVDEFDKRRVSGDSYEASSLLQEVQKLRKDMLDRIDNIGGNVQGQYKEREEALVCNNLDNDYIWIDFTHAWQVICNAFAFVRVGCMLCSDL